MSPDAAPAQPLGEVIPLNIVFEDESLVIVSTSPPGLVVHPGAGHETGTLVNALIAHCGDSLSGIGGVKRPGIVHRLDKDTSGLLVVAKTDAAHHGLSRLFADHGRKLSLTREYLALVWGEPDRQAGVIDAPLGRHDIQREKMAVVPEERGREAITHWRLLEKFGADRDKKAGGQPDRLPVGDRTHASNSRAYGPYRPSTCWATGSMAAGSKPRRQQLPEAAQLALKALNRQALHAHATGFRASGDRAKSCMFESDPPTISRGSRMLLSRSRLIAAAQPD